MTDLKTKLAALHSNMTPGSWVAEYDPVSAQDHATLIELPGKAGSPGTWIARTEHNWNDASYSERRISWKEAETNAEWIALTGTEANRAQIIAALEAVEECERLRAAIRDMADTVAVWAMQPEAPTRRRDPLRQAQWDQLAAVVGVMMSEALEPRP